MIEREQILNKLRAHINTSGRIIGVAPGNGMIANYAVKGGADLILALTSGRFRQMGKSSLAGFLPFTNGNKMVMQFGSREIIPLINNVPVIFGLCASDPTINLEVYIEKIHNNGFSGIVNYPSVGVIDGKFRQALEEMGSGFQKEVEAIRMAKSKDIFTIAFVYDEMQAEQMSEAGADVICANIGLTKGGELGAKKVLSLQAGVKLVKQIFDRINEVNDNTIKMVYGGPVNSPIDLKYIYDYTEAVGYIGGSTFERIPTEQFITERIINFKETGYYNQDKLLQKMLEGVRKHYNYVDFVKEYISENYMNEISFNDLAVVAHVSRPYLSTLFKKDVGYTFPEYLAKFRVGKAIEIMKREDISFLEISNLVGYKDYAHFSRTFKRITGLSPKEFREQNKNS